MKNNVLKSKDKIWIPERRIVTNSIAVWTRAIRKFSLKLS